MSVKVHVIALIDSYEVRPSVFEIIFHSSPAGDANLSSWKQFPLDVFEDYGNTFEEAKGNAIQNMARRAPYYDWVLRALERQGARVQITDPKLRALDDGPYRGHVPVVVPTLGDTLEEMARAAKSEYDREFESKMDAVWPQFVEWLEAEAKKGLSCAFLRDFPGVSFLRKGSGLVLPALFKRRLAENGLVLRAVKDRVCIFWSTLPGD